MRVEQAWEGIDLQLEKGDAGNSASSASAVYLVFETASDIEAITAAYSESPADIEGIPKKSAEISERLAEDIWKIEISYGYSSKSSSPSSGSQDEATVSFDCGGGTRHVNTALEQKKLWQKSGATIKNPGKFVGWNGKTGPDSVISGVDVPFAQPRETYTKKMSLSQLSTSFRRKMAGLVGCINSAKWKGWERGEVMFLGCSYSGSASEEITVTFNFAIQMNESMVIADGVPKINKTGHEYIWTMSETKYDTVNKAPQLEVTAVYAALVAPYADFSTLGL